MAKCECCGEKEATVTILEWADVPRYGVPDLKEAVISYECLPSGATSVEVRAMGVRIRARRTPRSLPATLPAGTKAFFKDEIFVATTEVVRRGESNAYDGGWAPSSGKDIRHPPEYMWAEQIFWNEVAKAQETRGPAQEATKPAVVEKPLYNGNDLELDSEIAMKMAAHPNHRKPYFRPDPPKKPDVVHVWPEHWATPSWES